MTGRRAVEVLPDGDTLAAAAAARIAAAAEAAIRARGVFIVALSGGETPRRTYQRLAEASGTTRLPWSQVQVLWGDERCVPPDHPDSNYRMACDALLDHVAVPAANIHRMRGEDEPAAAASRYEGELRELLRGPAARIDLVLLGLGAEGHTASLFPGGAALHETRRWVMAEYVPVVSGWRVTQTLVLINAAADVLFLVSGARKADIVRRVLEGPAGSGPPAELPAQAVAPARGTVRWLIDRDAGAELGKGSR